MQKRGKQKEREFHILLGFGTNKLREQKGLQQETKERRSTDTNHKAKYSNQMD